ncbi:hypothetical protein HG537_0D01490 [Torulaspora globosa]|uniref:Uncharacterized protein n=1 Tax=Torulaspora globosa TaxID=48254 RepID=A0A7H9HQY4_9SACH|nr:hypothetical protein HG537_0D01490 [Torulaspora sp. CBS 2947]
MQGGIRRKRDLLPRYKNNGRGKNGLTTPMKKIIAYVFLLSVVFVLLRLGFADLSREISYELDGTGGSRETVPFNNEPEKGKKAVRVL